MSGKVEAGNPNKHGQNVPDVSWTVTSGSCSRSSAQNINSDQVPFECQCGKKPLLLTWIEKNFGCPFWRCPLWKDPSLGCDFFKWLNEGNARVNESKLLERMRKKCINYEKRIRRLKLICWVLVMLLVAMVLNNLV